MLIGVGGEGDFAEVGGRDSVVVGGGGEGAEGGVVFGRAISLPFASRGPCPRPLILVGLRPTSGVETPGPSPG